MPIMVSQKLKTLLLRQVPEAFAVRKEGPSALQDSEPEPGISVARGKTGDCIDCHPLFAELIIEATLRSFPRALSKAEVYAEDNVPEYWRLRLAARAVNVYRQPSGGQYASLQTLTEQETLRCAGIPQGEIAVRGILPRSGET